jgi:hypothetical protein
LIGVSADIWAIDRLRDAGDFALAHGATQHAAEQALADIATFEAEKANQALKERPPALPEFSPDQESDGVSSAVRSNMSLGAPAVFWPKASICAIPVTNLADIIQGTS